VFTPKKMNGLVSKVREVCARSLDPLMASPGFDLVADLGAQMPMRVIGMLLGIPEQDQESIRDGVDASLRTEPGQPQQYSGKSLAPLEAFADYIDWRADHPSDDLMTELLHAEFEAKPAAFGGSPAWLDLRLRQAYPDGMSGLS
jgi:cytochrome P450